MKSFTRAMILAAPMLTAAASQQARADVVVIVSAASVASNLTTGEISRIYLGQSNRMTPIDIADPSKTRHEFYSKVTGKDEFQVKSLWSKLVFTGKAPAPRELSPTEVVKAVAADPYAIGYVDRSFVNIPVKIVYVVK